MLNTNTSIYHVIATHIDYENQDGTLKEFDVFDSDNRDLARDIYERLASRHNDLDYDPITVFMTTTRG